MTPNPDWVCTVQGNCPPILKVDYRVKFRSEITYKLEVVAFSSYLGVMLSVNWRSITMSNTCHLSYKDVAMCAYLVYGVSWSMPAKINH